MTFKGPYSAETTYAVGDVVKYSNDVWYHAQQVPPTGTPPTETLYWGKVDQPLADALDMVLTALEMDKKTAPNISEDAILLKSSTASSTKQFLITVDDDGELTATEVEE